MRWQWVNGLTDTVTGIAKRAAGELGARPDLVLEGEAQQAKGIAGIAEGHYHVVGWKLEPRQRRNLIARFPPRYANAVADHVTLKAGVAKNCPPPKPVLAEIVGHVDDGKGVEAMIVAIDGNTDRPGGGTYHITWSLALGRRAQESNDIIAERGWTPFSKRVAVQLRPANFR